jgi:predicted nuclease of predicted toxin-antitoxin system
VRFYLDEDLSPKVADIARARCGLDVVTAHRAGTLEWSDEAQLRYAAQDGRCVVTRNRDDFIAETLAAYEVQGPHAGVLIVPHTLPNDHFPAIATALCAYSPRFSDGLQQYTIDFLPPSEGHESNA